MELRRVKRFPKTHTSNQRHAARSILRLLLIEYLHAPRFAQKHLNRATADHTSTADLRGRRIANKRQPGLEPANEATSVVQETLSFLPGFDQGYKLSQVVKGIRIQFGIFDTDPKTILHKKGEIHQTE